MEPEVYSRFRVFRSSADSIPTSSGSSANGVTASLPPTGQPRRPFGLLLHGDLLAGLSPITRVGRRSSWTHNPSRVLELARSPARWSRTGRKIGTTWIRWPIERDQRFLKISLISSYTHDIVSRLLGDFPVSSSDEMLLEPQRRGKLVRYQ